MSDLSINYDELATSAKDLASAAAVTRAATTNASSDIDTGSPAVDAAFDALVQAQRKLCSTAADRCDAYADGYRSVSNLFEGLDRQTASNVGQLSFGKNETFDLTGNGAASGGSDETVPQSSAATPVPGAEPPVMTRSDGGTGPAPDWNSDPFVDFNNLTGSNEPRRLADGEKLPAPDTH